MLDTDAPTTAALACAKRFLEIEEKHGTTHKGRWAMFATALAKHGVDEWEVEEALEYLDAEAEAADEAAPDYEEED